MSSQLIGLLMDTFTRREALGGIAAVGASVGLAGCAGPLVPESVTAAAAPTDVPQAALEETGFSHGGTEKVVMDNSAEVSGQTVEYDITNWVSIYYHEFPDRPIPRSRFGVLATPSVQEMGMEANPVGRKSYDALARAFSGGEFSARGITIDVGERVGFLETESQVEPVEYTLADQTQLTVQGRDTRMLSYDTVGEYQDDTYEGKAYVLRVTHDGDILVIGGGHDRRVDDRAAIEALAQAVVHPAEN